VSADDCVHPRLSHGDHGHHCWQCSAEVANDPDDCNECALEAEVAQLRRDRDELLAALKRSASWIAYGSPLEGADVRALIARIEGES
jgi:hypothetical protein